MNMINIVQKLIVISFSLSREAKCINIISTQSYSSLKKYIKR